jgi:hypothetical protein
MALKPLTTVLTTPATPPRRSPGPYKRQAPSPSFTAPLPAHISLSPRSSLPLTERRHHRALTIVTHPPRRRSSPGEALIELPVRSSLCCAPAAELWRTGAARGRAPVSTPPCRRRSTVDRARPAGPRIYPLEINSLFGLFRNFAKRSLDFWEINLRSRLCRLYTQTPRVFQN